MGLMIAVYSADVCPFAHRTRALLTHLGIDFDSHIVNLKDRDPGFLKLTPTGKVPLLVDGDMKLYESRIINDYIAEKYDLPDAYHRDAYPRARQRLAMLQWDEVVLRLYYKTLGDPEGMDQDMTDKVGRELDAFQETIALTSGVENLMGFHFAPFWARMGWLRHLTGVPALIDQRPELRAWLDRAVTLPSVQKTLPDREPLVRSYQERFAGTR